MTVQPDSAAPPNGRLLVCLNRTEVELVRCVPFEYPADDCRSPIGAVELRVLATLNAAA